jgi:hypothetical protein
MNLALLPALALAAGSALAAPPPGPGAQAQPGSQASQASQAPQASQGSQVSQVPDDRIAEEVVAVILFPNGSEQHVITLTRLAEEARIALVSRGAMGAAARPLDAAALRAGLEWLVDQTVLMDEVTRLNVLDVERKDVLQELARFRSRFSKADEYQAFLERLDISPEELMAVLRRMLRVQRYVESRVSGAARVRDAEVEAYFREHRSEFAGRDLGAVREAVRAHLAQERIKADVSTLLAELRTHCELRILADLDRVGAGR